MSNYLNGDGHGGSKKANDKTAKVTQATDFNSHSGRGRIDDLSYFQGPVQ